MTRRAVLTAGAWAVPAISVEAGAPLSTASSSARWTVTSARTVLYPDETTVVRVSGTDGAGRPRRGEAVTLSVSGAGAVSIDRPTGITDSSGVFETTVRVRSGARAGTETLASSSGSGGAVAGLEVRAPVAVVHAPGGTSTRVTALPHGIQDEVMAFENRGLAHSDLQPTGRSVSRGQVLTVVVDADAPATLALVIGTRGPWSGFNGGAATDLQVVPLVPGSQRITAAQDGIVYVKNSSTQRAITATLSGGAPHPVWVKEHTLPDEFAAQTTAWASAPVVTLVGDRVFADVQRRVVDDLGSRGVAWSPATVLDQLDRVVALTCEVYGLSYAAVGIARKYPGRVHISGADSGAGWAFAAPGWLCFQVDTGASESLLTEPDSWGVWHEVGHTFQTPAYTWTGLGEVTVNISSLAVQQRTTGEHRLDEWPEAKDRVARHLAQPAADRNFDQLAAEDPFLPLFLFDQLRQAFGDGFYPAVSQAYRVRRIRGVRMPASDQDERDLFAQITSQVADRDLGPFFTAWGVTITASVLTSLRSRPALTYAIWTAVDSRDAHVERRVGYDLPVGVLTVPARSLYLAERDTVLGDASAVSTLSGAAATVVSRESWAHDVGPAEGRIVTVLQAADGTPEALWRPAPVTVVSALEFVGIYDVRAGWLGISRDGKRLVVTSTGAAPHDYYFKGKLYYQVTLQNAARRTLVSVSVDGDDTHDKVVAALDGVAVATGYRLRVNAAEPSRVRVYQDGAAAGTLSSTPQTLLIRDGRFVV